MNIRAWLREPLVHFIAAGALIFVVAGVVGSTTNESRRIEITPALVDRLQQVFAAQWRRPPTPEELDGLIESHIEEEVLYREALALGLDQDDTIVRRRLAQKMQFMIEDVAVPPAPTDAELEAYFNANREQFRLPTTVTFSHVYFSVDRRADAERDARTTLAKLGDEERAAERGDAFMLRYDYADITEAELGRLFGREFAAAVFDLPVGGWQGPVRSGYGFHLVRIDRKDSPPEPTFAGARDGVLAAYLEAERRRMNRDVLDGIMARYEIVRSAST